MACAAMGYPDAIAVTAFCLFLAVIGWAIYK